MTTTEQERARQAAVPSVYVQVARALHANLRHVLLGAPSAVTVAVVAALSGGHLLIEDVPGVGKTVLARGLAASLGAGLSRVQGHPDLLPTDVTGVSTFSPGTGDLGVPTRARSSPTSCCSTS